MDDDHIRSLREALLASPENPPLLKLLAQALASGGQHAEAAHSWKALLRLQPASREARLGLAACYEQSGDHSAAVVLCEQLLNERSDDAQASLILARCRYREGDLSAAADAYQVVRIHDPQVRDPALDPLLEDRALRQGSGDAAEGDPAIAEVERPKVTFAQVGGMEAVKDEIRMKIIHPLAHPELFAAYGKKVGGGVLLYGPPGCGKTHLARATAGEVKARFMSIGISDVLDMWIGASERNLSDLFAQARANQPCVLFFDEVDALAASRRDMRQSASRQTINQFLAELDGVDTSNEGVLVVAATNAPWHLDSAFRRPGRFDRILFVPPPDQASRVAILRVLLADKPCADLDVEAVAKATPLFSGADLRGLIDRACEAKLHEALASGKPVPLATRDLLQAAKGLKPSTREWFSSARNHALYANQDGTYDSILDFIKQHRL